MHLSETTVRYDDSGTTISASLRFDELDEAGFEPWFQLPLGWQVDTSSSPFVPFGTAIAAWYGEDLVVEGPVRDQVLDSARAAAPLLSSFAQRPPIQVHGPTVPMPRAASGPRRTGLFVSRGVDSSACLVLAEQGRLTPRPDLGIVVSGIEPFASDRDAQRAVDQSLEVAAAFDIEPVVVRTNLWDQVHPRITYANVHGSALFGIALALSHHLQDVVIASAAGWRSPPLGSHRELDHLWGNEQLGVHLLPEDMERSERVRVIAQDGRALSWLRVCWLHPDGNCGRCRKCILTAALLDACGALEQARTFDRGPVDPEELRRHPPGNEFLDDVCTVLPEPLANAARLSQDRYTDPWTWQPELVRLRSLLEVQPTSDRPVPWCFVAPPTDRTGEAVAAATAAFGEGLVWVDEAGPARPAAGKMLSTARFAVWDGPDDRIELERVLLALEHGARPVQVVGHRAADALAGLPPLLRSIAREPHEMPALAAEPPEVVQDLARLVASGGAGWLRRPS